MNIKDILLKLHYMNLEINEIYVLLKKIYQEKCINEKILRKILKEKYGYYEKLEIDKINYELETSNTKFISILDKEYPENLQNIFMPPLILFYQGDLSLINNFMIAVIGSRANTNYGEKVARLIVNDLVKHDITIISGLAYGIDSIAHLASIEANGKTIAVLGSGFLNIYPKAHIDLANRISHGHLLISEYPPHVKASKTHFPFRNRIVSGLSSGVLVIEAKERSGTLITCDYALDQGKDIFVIPNHIFAKSSVGTNTLIKQGAKLVTGISDVLENFNI